MFASDCRLCRLQGIQQPGGALRKTRRRRGNLDGLCRVPQTVRLAATRPKLPTSGWPIVVACCRAACKRRRRRRLRPRRYPAGGLRPQASESLMAPLLRYSTLVVGWLHVAALEMNGLRLHAKERPRLAPNCCSPSSSPGLTGPSGTGKLITSNSGHGRVGCPTGPRSDLRQSCGPQEIESRLKPLFRLVGITWS